MGSPRREVTLPRSDLEFLELRGFFWETIVEGNVRWLLVHDYGLPGGYSVEKVSVALQLAPSYPDTEIDMAYFHPSLVRTDGAAIRKTTRQSLGGQNWQRWSRHRTCANPWRRGTDCIETHLLLVDEWLERELRRSA